MRVLLTLLTVVCFSNLLFAQPPNDECAGAIFLPDVENWCSEAGEFDNVEATESAQPFPSCLDAGDRAGQDVWFVFTAPRTSLSIRVVGDARIFSGGSLTSPAVALYSGNCGNLTEVICDVDADGSVSVVTIDAPVDVGETYFLRVDSRLNIEGTFQLCFTSFEPVPDPISDCEPGVLLCDKAPFIVPIVNTAGGNTDEIPDSGMPCTPGSGQFPCEYDERFSAWYKWICDESGSLTFTLTPLNPVDDLDFWVYELPNGVDDCSVKMPLRCMASGENQQSPASEWIRCHGPTGLRDAEGDDHEDCGCQGDNNNFIAPLQMEAGKAYVLVVMNYSRSGDGFAVNFGGTGTFVGPDIDFEIDPELENQCDISEITFTNQSTSGIGAIDSYQWFFGNGANMRDSDMEGPHNITYESFGTKNIVLRIGTDAGCQKTLIKEIFIEPCCDPDNTLALDLVNRADPLCPGIPGGFFNIDGTGGSPNYSFSSDGVNFNPVTSFNRLEAGTYNVWVQDIKGCRDSMEVVISPAPDFEVDAGNPQLVQLGCETDLNATVNSNGSFTVAWDTVANMSCIDCLDPTIIPPGATTYVIEAISEAGCTDKDSVFVDVEIVRPFFIPSAFSPNNDGINDFFIPYGGKQVKEIQKMLVFDRWGNMLFENTNFQPGVESEGWNGIFRGEEMDPYVFAYYFEVVYIDDAVVQYEGDVTLVR